MIKENCQNILACGHPCRGFFGEEKCLPCLNANCAEKAREEAKHNNMIDWVHEGIDEDAFCSICWISGLGSEPCIKIGCGHVYHINCIKEILKNKWTTPRVIFNFLNCPGCK